MDQQDKVVSKRQTQSMQHEELTRMILGSSFDVIKELGSGFLESVYERSLAIALREKGLAVKVQYPIRVMFRGQCVGEFIADLFVEEKVMVELKAVKVLSTEHQAQVINYLKATGVEVGLLINFGNPKLDYRRLTRSKVFSNNMDGQDEQDGSK